MPREGYSSVTITDDIAAILRIASEKLGKSQSEITEQAILKFIKEVKP